MWKLSSSNDLRLKGSKGELRITNGESGLDVERSPGQGERPTSPHEADALRKFWLNRDMRKFAPKNRKSTIMAFVLAIHKTASFAYQVEPFINRVFRGSLVQGSAATTVDHEFVINSNDGSSLHGRTYTHYPEELDNFLYEIQLSGI